MHGHGHESKHVFDTTTNFRLAAVILFLFLGQGLVAVAFLTDLIADVFRQFLANVGDIGVCGFILLVKEILELVAKDICFIFQTRFPCYAYIISYFVGFCNRWGIFRGSQKAKIHIDFFAFAGAYGMRPYGIRFHPDKSQFERPPVGRPFGYGQMFRSLINWQRLRFPQWGHLKTRSPLTCTESMVLYHLGEKVRAHRGHLYFLDAMYRLPPISHAIDHMATGMAIIHHATSYCLSNQFTLQEDNSMVRIHSKTHRTYDFFFIPSTLPFIRIIVAKPKTVDLSAMKDECDSETEL